MTSALGNRAFIFEQLGRYDEAIKDLGSIISQEPNNLMAIKHLGFISRRKGDLSRALSWYKMAVPLENDMAIKKKIQDEIKELERKMASR